MSENGLITSKKTNFTQVFNYAIKDKNLSLKAKGLYSLISQLISIPDFKLYKQTLINSSSDGEKSFRSAWNELKDAGYLIQERKSTKKGFSYEYTLVENPNENKDILDNPTSLKQACGEKASRQSTCTKQGEYNNNQSNYTLQNNNINNNSFIHENVKHCGIIAKQLFDLKNIANEEQLNNEDFKCYLRSVLLNQDLSMLKEGIETEIYNGNLKSNYNFNDFIAYAAYKVNLEKNFEYAVGINNENAYQAYCSSLDWINAIASLLSNNNEYTYIGKIKYKSIDLKQRLVQLDQDKFNRILDKFNDSSYNHQIKNLTIYMQTLLINSCFDSGTTQDLIAPIGGWDLQNYLTVKN